MTRTASRSQLRRFLALFVPALAGIGALVVDALRDPSLLPPEAAALPTGVRVAAVALQPAVLAAVAVAVGLRTAPRLGLRSHLLARVSDGEPLLDGLRSETPFAAVVGFATGVVLILGEVLLAPAPPAVVESGTVGGLLASLPLRFLYGGITEEVLLRWGLLSAVAYVLARAVGDASAPADRIGWAAIAVAAALFGAGHLPVAAATYGKLTPHVVAWIVGGNAVGGVVYGWLFWTRSLESAMVAHAATHVAFVAAGLATLLA